MKKQNAKTIRSDGQETRALILECAGKIIAEKGMVAATSKAICEAAGINLAAVNYHFGSRENLYVEILCDVHDKMLSQGDLDMLYTRYATAEERIVSYIDLIIHRIYVEEDWRVRVWLREALSGNPLFEKVIERTVRPKALTIMKLFQEYFGLKNGDPTVFGHIICAMAPLGMLIVGKQSFINHLAPEILEDNNFWEYLRELILLDLRTQKAALLKKQHI